MLEYHEGMEDLGPLETTRKTVQLPIDWIAGLGKEDLGRLLKSQIEDENYEAAVVIKEKLEKLV